MAYRAEPETNQRRPDPATCCDRGVEIGCGKGLIFWCSLPRGHQGPCWIAFTDLFDEPNCLACGTELEVRAWCPNPDCR